jgi:hypothetical protein
VTKIIREVLKQFTEDQLREVDCRRVLVLTRAIMKQRKINTLVELRSVQDVVSTLRKRISGGLTAAKISEYESHIGDYKKKSTLPSPTVKKVSTTPPSTGMDLENLITCLHDASHFATECGGVDQAITVLHKLKGLQQS